MTRLLPHEEQHIWILRVWVVVVQHAADLLSWISTIAIVALTILAFFDEAHVGWVVVVGLVAIITAIGSQVLKKKQSDSIREAEQKAQSLQDDQENAATYLRDVIQELVLELLREANLINDHSRVSVYQHDPQRGKFVPVARASGNPELEKPGRTEYADNYGIIRDAWQKGKAAAFRLPEDPHERAEAQTRQYDIPLHIARSIRMKSRSYVGLRIDYGTNSSKVGIAILESLNAQGVTNQMSDHLADTDVFRHLAIALAVGPKPPRQVLEDEP